METFAPGLFRCPECNLITCDSPKDANLYDEKYLEHYRELSKTELGEKIAAFRWGFLRRYMNGHTTLLDYGAGPGAFLRSPHAIPGVKLEGYDINPASEFCKDYSRRPDVVTAFDVIEHMESPREWIEHLNPKLLVILTPNVDPVMNTPSRGPITGWRHYKPGEHLHYYGLKSLSALIHKCGYRVEGWDYLEATHRNQEHCRDLVTMAASR